MTVLPARAAMSQIATASVRPPTFVTLTVLSGHASPRAALAAVAAGRPVVYLPRIAKGADGVASLYPGDAGWEARDADLPGARHRLVFLPSGWRYLREGA